MKQLKYGEHKNRETDNLLLQKECYKYIFFNTGDVHDPRPGGYDVCGLWGDRGMRGRALSRISIQH